MFDSIWEDVKREFRHGNMISRLVIVNLAFFIGIYLIKLGLVLAAGFQNAPDMLSILRYISLSSSWWFTFTHPWVILTHMFVHLGFFHFLFNMLFLYWFGRIVGDLIGDHRIVPLYLLGGLAGAAAFLLTAPFIYPGGSPVPAWGASAGVMAIVVASGVLAPDYLIRLILIGDVRLKYVVGVLLLLDLIGLANLDNTGGHLGHLGGAFMGFFFVRQLQKGRDLSEPVNRFFDKLLEFLSSLRHPKRRNPQVVYKNSDRRAKGKGQAASDSEQLSHQEKVDTILDKIKKSGYDSLSDEEKSFLFNASRKN